MIKKNKNKRFKSVNDIEKAVKDGYYNPKYFHEWVPDNLDQEIKNYVKERDREINKPIKTTTTKSWFSNLWSNRLIPAAIAASFAIGVVTTPLINFFTRTAPQVAPVFRGGEQNEIKDIDFNNLTIGDKFEDTEKTSSWRIIKKYTTDTDGICLLTRSFNTTIFNQGSIYEFCSSGSFKVYDLEPYDESLSEPRYWITPDNSPLIDF
jgi:hypothetical protein